MYESQYTPYFTRDDIEIPLYESDYAPVTLKCDCDSTITVTPQYKNDRHDDIDHYEVRWQENDNTVITPVATTEEAAELCTCRAIEMHYRKRIADFRKEAHRLFETA